MIRVLFVVDANISKGVVRLLSGGGHTVLFRAVAGNHSGDGELAGIAKRANAVILTKDKDFIRLYKEDPSFTVLLLAGNKSAGLLDGNGRVKSRVLRRLSRRGCYRLEGGHLYALLE